MKFIHDEIRTEDCQMMKLRHCWYLKNSLCLFLRLTSSSFTNSLTSKFLSLPSPLFNVSRIFYGFTNQKKKGKKKEIVKQSVEIIHKMLVALTFCKLRQLVSKRDPRSPLINHPHKKAS